MSIQKGSAARWPVMTYREAFRTAMAEEMERDESVVIMGEDIGVYGGTHLVTDGLLDRFGPKRVIDTPIAEGGFTGAAIGMAMMGMRPIVEMMTWNFSFQAADQIIQNAAKIRYFSGGQVERAAGHPRSKRRRRPALRPAHPQPRRASTATSRGSRSSPRPRPQDAKGMMLTAIRDPDPVIFLEAGALYGTKGEVPDGEYTVAVRQGPDRPRRHRRHPDRLRPAGQHAAARGRSARRGADLGRGDRPPLDPPVRRGDDRRRRSRRRTGPWSCRSSGAGSASPARWPRIIQEQAFDDLDAPVERVSGAEVPAPYARKSSRWRHSPASKT